MLNSYFIATHKFLKQLKILFFSLFLFVLNAYSQDNIPDSTWYTPDTKSSNFFIINIVKIEGNKITHPNIIRRELDFKEGSMLPVAKMDSLLKWERNKVFNTNLFVTVDVILEETQNPLYKNLVIKVKEQWYTIPQLILDPADRNLNEWIFQRGAALNRVNIGMKLFQFNCRGRKETLRLTLQTGFTHNYELSYEIPYLDRKQTFGIRPYVSYFNNRSIAYKTDNHVLEYIKSPNEAVLRNFFKTGIIFNYRKKFFLNHQLDLAYNYNRIADTIAYLNPDYFLKGRTHQNYINVKYTFNFDKRDVRQYAKRGYQFTSVFEQSGITLYEDLRQTSFSAYFARYYKLSNKFYYAGKLKARTSFPQLQPFILFKGLGYQQDLVRGFELYAIDGQHFVLNRNSIRYKAFEKIFDFGQLVPIRQFRTMPVEIYLTAFADWGSAFNDKPLRTYPNTVSDNTLLSNRLLGSVGLGAHLVTFYNSVLRFEYSLNSIGQAQFFFSIGTDI